MKPDFQIVEAPMDAWTLRVLTHLVSVLLFLPCYQSLLLPASSTLCKRPTLEEFVSVGENQCPLDRRDEFRTVDFAARGVVEVNGLQLERSLKLMFTQEGMHAAVLVYARWCPFSRELLPVFDSLASTFPSIYHFVVEESALQPSAYSYYGVHSFPVLLLHNKTVKVRYQGPRSYEAIARFYKEYSGFQPVVCHHESAVNRKEAGPLARVFERRPLRDEFYLLFAVIFLVSRVLLNLLPRLMNTVKQQWYERFLFWKARRSLLPGVFLGCSKQILVDTNSTRKSIKGKSPKTDFTQETGKVLLSVPGWPSSSLSSVTLAEGSSSRTGGCVR